MFQTARMQELVRSGGLSVDAGRAVPSVERLLSRIWAWEPAAHRERSLPQPRSLHQAVSGRVRVIERARGGGESTSNIHGAPVPATRYPIRRY